MKDISNSLREQIFRRKCPSHPWFSFCMLLLDPNVKQHKACFKCLIESKLLNKSVCICTLLRLDSSVKYPLYPLEDDKIIKMLNTESNIEKLLHQIEEYYSKLESNIIQSIKGLIQKDFQIIQKEINEWKLSINKLNNLISINIFQELLQCQDIDSEKQLHNYIVQRQFQCEEQMKEIKENFKRINKFKSCFSTQQPLIIQQEILNQIQSIDLFQKKQNKLDVSTLECLSTLSEHVLQIDRVNKKLVLTNNVGDNTFDQYYLNNELDATKRFKLVVELRNVQGNIPAFIIGLIESNNKKSELLCNQSNIVYSELDNFNKTTLIIKGGKINAKNGEKQIGKKTLEIRFCQNDRIWEVSTYPDHSNVSQLQDPSVIDPSNKYHIAFAIAGKGDSITLKKLIEVSEFDQLI